MWVLYSTALCGGRLVFGLTIRPGRGSFGVHQFSSKCFGTSNLDFQKFRIVGNPVLLISSSGNSMVMHNVKVIYWVYSDGKFPGVFQNGAVLGFGICESHISRLVRGSIIEHPLVISS